MGDRKSTRLNSSHVAISYAVFCLKKKKRHPSLESLFRWRRKIFPQQERKRAAAIRSCFDVLHFFFYWCCYHRDLHSFPTRRSSDPGLVQPPRHLTHWGEVWKGASLQIGTRTDRKSTRLNSSHVAISYAVFCLKK